MLCPSSVLESVGIGFVMCASYEGCEGKERTPVQAIIRRKWGAKSVTVSKWFFITGWKWDSGTEWIFTGSYITFIMKTELCKKLQHLSFLGGTVSFSYKGENQTEKLENKEPPFGTQQMESEKTTPFCSYRERVWRSLFRKY
jgi:hypothetical protein